MCYNRVKIIYVQAMRRIYFNPTGGRKSMLFPDGVPITPDDFPKARSFFKLYVQDIACLPKGCLCQQSKAYDLYAYVSLEDWLAGLV